MQAWCVETTASATTMTLTDGYSEEVKWSCSCIEGSSRSGKGTGRKRTERNATLRSRKVAATTEGLARPMGISARELAGGHRPRPGGGERRDGRGADTGRRYTGSGRGTPPGAAGATDGDGIPGSAPDAARPPPGRAPLRARWLSRRSAGAVRAVIARGGGRRDLWSLSATRSRRSSRADPAFARVASANVGHHSRGLWTRRGLHRPGAERGFRALRGRPGPAGRGGVFGRRIVRLVTWHHQRRPLPVRDGLFPWVHGPGGSARGAADLHLPRCQRSGPADRPHQSQDRAPVVTGRLRRAVPRIQRSAHRPG